MNVIYFTKFHPCFKIFCFLGPNFASKFFRANGITLSKVREETVKLLGKADMYFFSPEHPPLTEDAQRALDWAVDESSNLVCFYYIYQGGLSVNSNLRYLLLLISMIYDLILTHYFAGINYSQLVFFKRARTLDWG